jgi:serine/threonine protein kinase
MTTSSEVAGSLRWMSPELIRGNPVSVSSDVWAYGMTALVRVIFDRNTAGQSVNLPLKEILSGKRPYHDIKLDILVFSHITNGALPLRPASDGVSFLIKDEIWAIFQQCWENKATDRPSMEAVTSEIIAVDV